MDLSASASGRARSPLAYWIRKGGSLVGDTDPHNHIGAVGAVSRWQLDDVGRHDSGLAILTYRRPEAPMPTTDRSSPGLLTRRPVIPS